MAKQNAPGSLPEATGHKIATNRCTNAISGGPFINKHKDHDFCSELSLRMRPIRLVIFIARPSISLISIWTIQPRLLDFGVVEKILALLHDTCTIPGWLKLTPSMWGRTRSLFGLLPGISPYQVFGPSLNVSRRPGL